MRAAEGQKRSYVEMILSSEVEVKLSGVKWWKRGVKGGGVSFAPRPVEGEGETSSESPPPPPH